MRYDWSFVFLVLVMGHCVLCTIAEAFSLHILNPVHIVIVLININLE